MNLRKVYVRATKVNDFNLNGKISLRELQAKKKPLQAKKLTRAKKTMQFKNSQAGWIGNLHCHFEEKIVEPIKFNMLNTATLSRIFHIFSRLAD